MSNGINPKKLQRTESRAFFTRARQICCGGAGPAGELLLSRTKQSFRDQCDINVIVEKHRRTGLITHVNNRTPLYGDFSKATDLQSAIERVHAAEDSFDALPSGVRAAAENSPVRFLEMLDNPAEVELLEKAGLTLDEKSPPASKPPVREPAEPEPEGRPAPAATPVAK